MKKLTYFCDIDPDNYCAQDNMRHLYFKDYKSLRNVSFDEVDTEPLPVKILASLGLCVVLLVLLFI